MPPRAQKNVGVIGLGIIGERVAANLRRRGFQVYVWNRTPRPFPNFVGSPAELAAICDFVQIFVSDDEALLQMVREMTPELGAHHIVMGHSTVAPDSMRAAAEIVQRRGAELLDAPFTGSKLAAEKGELIYYVGGDEMALRRARPVLQASSKEIVEIGAIGEATAVKVATNIVTAATVQAAVEALALAHGAGISPDQFNRALRSNATHSGTLGFKMPNIIKGDFAPHFSVKHMLKDVEIAARMAHSLGINLPANAAARDCLEEELRQGRGEADYSSVARQYFSGDLENPETDNANPPAEQLELEERTYSDSRDSQSAVVENPETHDAHPPAEQLKLEEPVDIDAPNPQSAVEALKLKAALDSPGDFTLSPDPGFGQQPIAPVELVPPAPAEGEPDNTPTFPQMNGSDARVPESDARAETPPATETRPSAEAVEEAENALVMEAMPTAESAPSTEAAPAAKAIQARENSPAAEAAAEATDAGLAPAETARRGFFGRFLRRGRDS